jgi:transcriptional regulator with XRE-family HTH domain
MSEFFGLRLRAFRQAQGMTIAEIAKEFGVSKPTWATWELGTREPKLDMIRQFCPRLSCTPNQLLGFDDTPPVPAIITGNNSPVAIGSNITQSIIPQKKRSRGVKG